MRHRTDLNQPDIITALKKIGCSVYVCGRPTDLVVGYRGYNFLIDCKRLKGSVDTPFQKEFFRDWKGQVRKCHSAEEAIKLVTEGYKSEKVCQG